MTRITDIPRAPARFAPGRAGRAGARTSVLNGRALEGTAQ